jgi:hypothetical protein
MISPHGSLLFFVLALGSVQTPGAMPVATSGRLDFTAPSGWKSRPAVSAMRVAEFVLPRAGGDTDDAELTVYYFGGAGGSVDANIQRWAAQIQPTSPPPARENRTVNGLTVTVVDLSGTYIAELRPGSPERHNKPGYRMRAAVVETPRGPYFIKMVGPAGTVSHWGSTFSDFLNSLRFVP